MVLQINQLPKRLREGASVISEYKFLNVSERGILVKAVQGNKVCVEKNADSILIAYDTEPHFYMALARSLVLPEGVHEIDVNFRRLGFQIDCSRNAVPTPEMLKRLICLLLLAGYDYLQLYTEDTYELPDEPYFGYMRGRYHIEELREAIDFAKQFSLEIVPCIQTLAHLSHFNNWLQYFEHMDINDIMLADDERTYALIRKMLSFWVENFQLHRINIGMDEAPKLGLGKYLEQHGYQERDEIYLRHLKKVFAICRELGIEPEFWGDMLYHTKISEERIKELFDGTQTPICWAYLTMNPDFYSEQFQKFQEYAGKTIYAGGCVKWIGFAPDNTRSMRVDDIAFSEAKKCGVENILITTWGDGGAECSVFAIIPAMWYAANLVYSSQTDVNRLLCELTGYSNEEWLICDCMNTTKPEIDQMSNVSKYAFYNDVLIGLLDENIAEDAGEVFAGYYQDFLRLAKKESQFSYIFKTYASLSRVLEKKATFGKRLYTAYHTGVREAVKPFMEELSELIARTEEFYQDYRRQWCRENKTFGLEVTDARIGSLIYRMKSARQTLEEYADGRLSKIYELEEKRLTYFDGRLEGEKQYAAFHNQWNTLFTVNMV